MILEAGLQQRVALTGNKRAFAVRSLAGQKGALETN
jgi:hypothetical protein